MELPVYGERNITPREGLSIEYRKYGDLFQLNENGAENGLANIWRGMDWTDCNTPSSVTQRCCFLGKVTGSKLPCKIYEMERHLHTEEVLIPLYEPIFLLVAPKEVNELSSENLEAIILNPDQVFKLHRGVWHSVAHGKSEYAAYLYLAEVYENEPTQWNQIQDGPVLLCP